MAQLVPALATLRAQFNARYPNRSKASDGWLGDAAHASRQSYHNADKNGWVHALDITHDPANGVDIDRITDELAGSKDNRTLELIANGLYWNYKAPKWVKYNGTNPHNKHFHISAKPGPTAMDARNWTLESFGGVSVPSPTPRPQAPAGRPTLQRGSTGPDVELIQRFLGVARAGEAGYGTYGPKTETAVKAYQIMRGIEVDGVVGPNTWRETGL